MPAFLGVGHFALSVTDLDRSQRFYTDVLGFMVFMDFGHGRLSIHKPSGFTLALVQHEGGTGLPFTELNTGVDHIAFEASGREELVEWERQFADHGVSFTPIRDMEFGYHLNFRDPDNIALEFFAPNDETSSALHSLAQGDMSVEEIAALINEQIASAPTLPQ